MGTGGVQTAQEAREAPPQHNDRRDQRENRRASRQSDEFNASAVGLVRERGEGPRGAMTGADALVVTQSGRGARRPLCASRLFLSVLGTCARWFSRDKSNPCDRAWAARWQPFDPRP